MPAIMDYIFEKVEKVDATMNIVQQILKRQLGINKTVANFMAITTVNFLMMSICSIKHGRAIKKLQKDFESTQNKKGE